MNFLKKFSLRNTIRVSNSLDPDQARHFVWPVLDLNCLQKLSADDTKRMSNGFDPDQDRHSVAMIWVQTVCKGYRQTTKVTASKESLNFIIHLVTRWDDQIFKVNTELTVQRSDMLPLLHLYCPASQK